MKISVKDEERDSPNTEKVYWDDLKVGEELAYGQYTVNEKEIIDFAKRYDPMEFHTDPEKAKLSPLGELCASGIHTLGIMQRLTFDHVYRNWHIVAGKELTRCQFLRPVFVNDILAVTMKVISLKSDTRNNRGSVELNLVVTNAKFQPVLEVQGEIILLKKTNK